MARFYADTTGRRTRQLVADLGFLLWTLAWIWAATRLYGLVLNLGAPGESLAAAGDSMSQSMVAAGEAVDGLPVVGEPVRAPFDRMSQAALAVADAGRAETEAVGKVAWFAAICLAVLPVATYLLIWLPFRVRFVGGHRPRNGSSTPPTTSTCSRCVRWPGSRCMCSPGSMTIPPAPGAAGIQP